MIFLTCKPSYTLLSEKLKCLNNNPTVNMALLNLAKLAASLESWGSFSWTCLNLFIHPKYWLKQSRINLKFLVTSLTTEPKHDKQASITFLSCNKINLTEDSSNCDKKISLGCLSKGTVISKVRATYEMMNWSLLVRTVTDKYGDKVWTCSTNSCGRILANKYKVVRQATNLFDAPVFCWFGSDTPISKLDSSNFSTLSTRQSTVKKG